MYLALKGMIDHGAIEKTQALAIVEMVLRETSGNNTMTRYRQEYL